MRRSVLVAAAFAAAFTCLAPAAQANTPPSAAVTNSAEVQALSDAIAEAAQAAETAARKKGLSEAEIQAEVESAILAVIAQSGADVGTVTAALSAVRAGGTLTTIGMAATADAQKVVAQASTNAPASTGGAKGNNSGAGNSPMAPPPSSGGSGGGSGYRPTGG